MNGNKFKFDVSGNTTIKELKQLLSRKIEKDCFTFKFFFGGEHLNDNESLDSLEMEGGEMIVVSFCGKLVNKTYSSNIDCMDKRGKIGDYYEYKIKGSEEGTVWGDRIYTDDSNIAKAAVLEGKCKLGEEKQICIKIIEGKSSYNSCSKNGISSRLYGYWDGSYIIL